MSSTSIYDTLDTFNQEFEQNLIQGMMAQMEGKKGAFKTNTQTHEKVKEIFQKAQASIESWVQKPESWFSGLKGKIRNFLLKSPDCTKQEMSEAKWYAKPVKWFGKQIHNWGESISQPPTKVSADEPYKLGELDDLEKVKLEKKANIFKTIAKVCLVAGGILLGVGLVVPLALGTFLFTLPESIILGSIIACTALGVVGVAAAVSYPILKNTKAVNEYEAETNEDFKRFVNEVVQKDDGGFNLRRKDIQNGKILKIFQEWNDSMKKLFSKKNLKKLEEERKALTS